MHCTWRDADAIGTQLVEYITIAVRRCTVMALQASLDPEWQLVMGRARRKHGARAVQEFFPQRKVFMYYHC